jgi:predicted nuclease of predicted toxin-antitoxin system
LNLFSCRILADENIHPKAIQCLKQEGCDVTDVLATGLSRQANDRILERARQESRIILTHDRDFGRLAILSRKPLHGIVFLRPGHIDPQFTITTLQVINEKDLDLTTPFILVARRRSAHV